MAIETYVTQKSDVLVTSAVPVDVTQFLAWSPVAGASGCFAV